MAWKKIFLLLLIILVLVLLKAWGFDQFLTFENLVEKKNQLESFYRQNPSATISLFVSLYILTTALALPGAAVLTLAAGAIFGLAEGVPLVSLASTTGATLSFIISRFLLRQWVEKKFPRQLTTINRGIEREGIFYLFTLRLIPAFPFFLINMLMGLTRMKTAPFFFVSLAGMLPGTIVYVNAGRQLSQIQSPADIFSPSLLLSFALLGVLPLLAKKFLDLLRQRQCYRPFKKPPHLDYNMIVIGGGAAGLVTAYISSSLKARVALIEKHKMGGDCLNTGCVPSKTLLKSASLIATARQSQKYGIKKMDVTFDFAQIMKRVKETIKKIEPHDSFERYRSLNVDCFSGKAEILSPWEVKINGKILTTANITIATGATPFLPSIPGIEEADFITSDTLWNLDTLPSQLVILGAGAVAVEMAQAFCRLGSQVTIVQRSSHILSQEDEDVAKALQQRLSDEGVTILTDHTPVSFQGNALTAQTKQGDTTTLTFDKLLIAVGRKPRISGFGLEKLGVRLRDNGTIEANQWLQTNFPNIWVCGDVTGPFQFTHTASHQAWYCAVNALLGGLKKFKVDYSIIPRAVYTDPEIAVVGKKERDCQAEGIPYEVTRYDIDHLDRAITDGEDHGFVKVLTRQGSDRILGAVIVGPRAGELILEFVTAMKHNFGLNAILSTIHPYPTLGEANKYLAGNWKKANKPEKILNLVEKYHQWKRG